MRDRIRRNLANYITALRIPFSLAMLPFPIFSPGYFAFFSLAGLSDFLDGIVARKLKIKSELGSKLDSIADLVFYITACAKLIPYLVMNMRMMLWVLLFSVLAMRIFLYGFAFIKYRSFPAHHTYLNKATGASVFLTIYLIPVFGDKAELVMALPIAIGMLAVAEEIAIVAMTSEGECDVHTLLSAVAANDESNP